MIYHADLVEVQI